MHASAHPTPHPITPLQLRAVLRMRAGSCRAPGGQRGMVLALRDTGGLFSEGIEALWMGVEAVAFYELHQKELVAGRCLDLDIDRIVSEGGSVVARVKTCQLAPLAPSWIKHAERAQHPSHQLPNPPP